MRKILEVKLNGGNIILGINRWVMSLLRSSATFLYWIRAELKQMDRRIRKLLTMHQAWNPKSNKARIYVSIKEGRRGQMSVEDTVK